MLAQTCPAQHHTALFARYSMSALLAGALGGLGAAALGLLTVAEPGTQPSSCTPSSAS